MPYPWLTGQRLYAPDLNAAITTAVNDAMAAQAASVPIAGGTMTGPLTLSSTAQSTVTNGSLYIGQSDFRRSTFWSQGTNNQIAQFSRIGSSGTDVAQVQSFYIVNHTGGPSGNVFNTEISTSCSGAPACGTWNFLAALTTTSAYPNKTTAGAATQVAGYSQAVRNAVTGGTTGVGLVGHIVEYHDNVDQPSSTRGSAVSFEIDWAGNNIDDDDSTGMVSLDLSLANSSGSDLLIGNGLGWYGSTHTKLKRYLMGAVPFTQAFLDARLATQGAGANAIWLADNQTVSLSSDGTKQLRWNTSTNHLEMVFGGGVIDWFDASGNSSIGGTFTCNVLTGNHTVTGNGSTITYAGATQSGNNTYALLSNVNLAGSLTAGSVNPNAIIINSDTASVPIAPQGVNWFSVNGNFGGTGTHGCRTGIYSFLNMNGAVSGANDSYKQFNGMLGTFQASANAGGTSLAGGTTAGFGYGGSDQSALLSGATFWSGILGREIDAGIATGASAAQRTGLQIVSFKDVQGSYEDSALRIGRATATAGGNAKAPGWKIGIAFGGWWPIDTSGAIMQMLPQSPGGLAGAGLTAVPPAAALGIDLTGVQFGTAAFRSTGGFVVDGFGAVNVGAAKLSVAASTVSLDASGNTIASVASVSGSPIGYVAGDVLWEPISGTVITLSTVNGSGAPTAWALSRPGGASGATFATAAFLGGTGNGVTFNLTWTAAPNLSLNPTGQRIGFNGTAPVAKPTVTGSRGGNAALASLITALASYGLITDSTTA